MVWVRLDDHFDENPKIAAVGPLGLALWTVGLAYCNRNLTDGFIPFNVANGLLSWEYLDPQDDTGRRKRWKVSVSSGMVGDDVSSERVIDLLVYAGLWEWDDDRGGYYIHDYDHFQPTRAEVEAERLAKQAAGRAGGQASALARAQAKAEATVQPLAQAKSKPVPVPVPVPVPDPETEPLAAAAARERDEAVGRLCREWERATGTTVTQMLGDSLECALDGIPEDWVTDAIRETGLAGAKSWKYTDAILQRWKTEGRGVEAKAPENPFKKSAEFLTAARERSK